MKPIVCLLASCVLCTPRRMAWTNVAIAPQLLVHRLADHPEVIETLLPVKPSGAQVTPGVTALSPVLS